MVLPTGLKFGAVVQLVRIPACHAGGRGFEPRPLRHLFLMTPPRTYRIWSHGRHTAYADLCLFLGEAWVVAREAEGARSEEGRIRILRHHIAQEWHSMGLLGLAGTDLRDPKLSVSPDGQLVLLATAVQREPGRVRHQSLVWISTDGRQWKSPRAVAEPDHWLWRITWWGKRAYGLAFATDGRSGLYWYALNARLQHWICEPVKDLRGQSASEHGLCFAPDGTAYALLRRDNPPPRDSSGLLGRAEPPYVSWDWRPLPFAIAGPCLVWNAASQDLLAGYRRYAMPGQWLPQWTEVSALSLQGEIRQSVVLISGGDCSYPGLWVHREQCSCVYHSSHEPQYGTALYACQMSLTSHLAAPVPASVPSPVPASVSSPVAGPNPALPFAPQAMPLLSLQRGLAAVGGTGLERLPTTLAAARPAPVRTPNPPAQAPPCWECVHFSVTWDANRPYGCALHGFKSRQVPAQVVFLTDGRHCLGFQAQAR
jgi:hypothetical protein